MRTTPVSVIVGSIAVIFSTAGWSFWESCPEADLSADFKKIPIRSQGSTPTCTFASVAAMFDFYRLKARGSQYPHGLGKDATSDLSLYVATTGDASPLSKTSPAAYEIMAKVAHKGPNELKACSLGDFKKTLGILAEKIPGSSIDDDLQLLVKGSEQSPTTGDLPKDDRCSGSAKWNRELDSRASLLLQSCGPGTANLDDIKGQISQMLNSIEPCSSATSSDQVVSTLYAAFTKQCSEPTPITELNPGDGKTHTPPYRTFKLVNKFKGDADDYKLDSSGPYDALGSALKAGNPVQITVCQKVLASPGAPANPDACNDAFREKFKQVYADAKNSGASDQDAMSKAIGAGQNAQVNAGTHSLVVIGAKKINGVCRYLVRNSWGADCAGYPGCNAGEGTQWIDSEPLKKALTVISYMIPDSNPIPDTGATQVN